MSLFSSPAFRVFNAENSESTMQRKPGATTLFPRKPFLDKTVNTLTPDVNKKQKSNLTIKEPYKAVSPDVEVSKLEINPEYYFSYKEIDDSYEDLFPPFKSLETQDVCNNLKNYLNDSTPPASPTLIKIPFDEPMQVNSLESSFDSNKSYDEDMFFDLPRRHEFLIKSVDDIELPDFDVDNI